jgi:hypothetical protein
MNNPSLSNKPPYSRSLMRLTHSLLTAIILAGLLIIPPVPEAQAAVLLNANFDSNTNGFTYQDDTFLGTSQPTYADGARITGSSCYGGSGGCLRVRLGGVDSNTIANMSGGWGYTLSLAAAQPGVSLTFRYRLSMPLEYDYDEYSRVLVSLNGALYGRGAKDYIDHAGGDNNFAQNTDWQQVSVYLGDLPAGNHTLILGGFNNQKNASTELTTILLDDVVLSSGNPAPVPSHAQRLVDRLDINNFKSNIETLASFGDRCRLTTCPLPHTSFANAQAWVEAQLQAMGYVTEKHVYTYTSGSNTYTGSNLYATKIGTVHPDQMYIISAHLDGRGGGGAADDDASGVSLTMEVARILAMPDVETDISVRFIFWDQEELVMIGSAAYVNDRKDLRGVESPPGSGLYPEPDWLGVIAHDMILYDHGVGTPSADQSPYADLDVEWKDSTTFAAQSKQFAQTWRFYNGEFAQTYPANSANHSRSTDDAPFHNVCPSISVRENRRNLSAEWINPYYHQTTDVYANYSEADFLLGLNAVQTTLGMMAQLTGARILAANQPPTADPQSVSTAEDTPLPITLTGSDPDGDPLSYVVVDLPSHGTLSGVAPALTYTPNLNFYGPDSFTFKVNDGMLDSDPATISITVNPVNDPPLANPQNLSTPQNTPLAITLTGSDVDGDSLTFAITSGPNYGSLSGTPPAVTYTPNSGFIGTDSFQFVANDGTVNSAPATVSITVEPSIISLPFIDDFETDKGWTVNPDGTDSATSGRWERANPQGTDFQGPKQLDVTTSGVNNLVTGPLAGSNATKFDLTGLSSIRSPLVQLPAGVDITLSFQYYFAHARNASSADFFRVSVIGTSTSTVLEVRGSNTNVDAAWIPFQVSLNNFAGQAVRIQIEAADLAKDSLVEAAVDDLSIIVTETTQVLVSADFNAGPDGFVYLDDAFRGTSQPDYASGSYRGDGGVVGGGLEVLLGGLDTRIIKDISGGWVTTFNLASPGDVVVSFWYNLTQSPDYDLGEYSQMLVSVDGVLYGSGVPDYVAQINGNGNGGIFESTGWQPFSVYLSGLEAGEHLLVIGGYNNQKSYTNEYTEVLIDQVRVIRP